MLENNILDNSYIITFFGGGPPRIARICAYLFCFLCEKILLCITPRRKISLFVIHEIRGITLLRIAQKNKSDLVKIKSDLRKIN